MAGLPGAVHYALASSLRRTQKVLSGLAKQTTLRTPPHPPALAAGGCATANVLETPGWGEHRGRRPSRLDPERGGREGGKCSGLGRLESPALR